MALWTSGPPARKQKFVAKIESTLGKAGEGAFTANECTAEFLVGCIAKLFADFVTVSCGVEDMLYSQLKKAVGKAKLTPADFQEYMTFHNRRLFNPHSRPTPFCYSIRRGGGNSSSPEVSWWDIHVMACDVI